MEFSIFTWGVAVLCYLIIGVAGSMLQMLCFPRFSRSCFLSGLFCVVLTGVFYIPNSLPWWLTLNEIFTPVFMGYKEGYAYLFQEVWYTVVFFRNLWPTLFIVLIAVVMESFSHPITARFRMMQKFNHNKLLIMVGTLFVYFFLYHFRVYEYVASLFLTGAVYCATYYWRFGFATLLYSMKKKHIPYEIGTALMIALPIVSGEYFLIALVLCIGIGISDIWMDYHQRDAASMVFNLDFH